MLSIFLAAAAASTPSPSTILATLPAPLARAVRDYDKAQIKGGAAAPRRLLADDYALVHSRGELEDKGRTVAESSAPGFGLDASAVGHAIVRQWRYGAVNGGEGTLSGVSDGRRFSARLRFADVWRRRAGWWQVAFTEIIP